MSGWWNRAARTEPIEPERMAIDFPQCIEREYPAVFAEAWAATEQTIAPLAQANLEPLERRSPGLRGYDWSRYLRCSAARVVRVLDALASVPRGARVLDVGSYFGNFALAAAARGFAVDALDSYAAYDRAFTPWMEALAAANVRTLDFADAGIDLGGLANDVYDAALLMGVIEHVPHSPKGLLTAVRRVLKPSGAIVLDTPNLAYAYNRERLARGESIMAPLASQFDCDPPFEGHHREYTMSEVRWMLERVGFDVTTVDAFNYSFYGLAELSGDDLRIYREMQVDPTRREVIFAAGRKPHG